MIVKAINKTEIEKNKNLFIIFPYYKGQFKKFAIGFSLKTITPHYIPMLSFPTRLGIQININLVSRIRGNKPGFPLL